MIKAVIFDLDGVIVSTDEFHYRAWKKISVEENIPFDRQINQRLRGISRMKSLEVILERSEKKYTQEEKDKLAERKNNYYKASLEELSPDDILPGVTRFMEKLKDAGIRTAIGSSSKNARLILERINLTDDFDAIVDGTEIAHSKPDPEVFLLAAKKLGIDPRECAVVEDAQAGIEAADKAGMLSVGVGVSARFAKIKAGDLLSIGLSDFQQK